VVPATDACGADLLGRALARHAARGLPQTPSAQRLTMLVDADITNALRAHSTPLFSHCYISV
jgi:hypothetical protein